MDVGRLGELRGVRDTGQALEIGALTTHYEVVRDTLIPEHCGLLAAATVDGGRSRGPAPRDASAAHWRTPIRPGTCPR